MQIYTPRQDERRDDEKTACRSPHRIDGSRRKDGKGSSGCFSSALPRGAVSTYLDSAQNCLAQKKDPSQTVPSHPERNATRILISGTFPEMEKGLEKRCLGRSVQNVLRAQKNVMSSPVFQAVQCVFNTSRSRDVSFYAHRGTLRNPAHSFAIKPGMPLNASPFTSARII